MLVIEETSVPASRESGDGVKGIDYAVRVLVHSAVSLDECAIPSPRCSKVVHGHLISTQAYGKLVAEKDC